MCDHLNDTVFCYCSCCCCGCRCCCRRCCCFVILFNWSYLFSMSFALKQFSYIIERRNRIGDAVRACAALCIHVRCVSRSRTPRSQTLHTNSNISHAHTHFLRNCDHITLWPLSCGGRCRCIMFSTSTFATDRIFIVIINTRTVSFTNDIEAMRCATECVCVHNTIDRDTQRGRDQI